MIRLILFRSFLCLFLLTPGSRVFAQTADFSASPVSGCAPLAVSFSDNSSGTVTTYAWNLGNSTSSASQNPSTTYSNPGSYTVTLTVTGPGGTDTKTATITVYDKPAVSFTAGATAGCTPHTTQFTSAVTANSPGNLSYSWAFGDGNTSTDANPFHTFTAAGTYTVSLTVTNGAGCSRTVVQSAYVTAYPVPDAFFSASGLSFCAAPATVNFTNNTTSGTTPYSAAWAFGDGGTATGNTPTHTYTAGGNYSVTMVVTDSKGCKDTALYTAYITVITTLPTFTAPATVCKDAEALFVNTTPGSSGTTWDFGDMSVGAGNNVSHFYSTPGTDTVTMTTVIGTCTKSIKKPITVHPKPRTDFTISPAIPCSPPVTVTFTSLNPSAAPYQWSWGRGGTASGQTATKTYTDYVQDEVKLIVTNSFGCTDSMKTDTVKIRKIVVDIFPAASKETGNIEGCIPLTVNFSANVQGMYKPWPVAPVPPVTEPYPAAVTSYRWDFGDGTTSTLATPIHTYTTVGTYNVRCIITTANGCVDSGFTRVHADIKVPPSFSASPLRACVRTPITFTNTTTSVTGLKYEWELGDTLLKKNSNATFTYSYLKPDTFTVRLISNNNGCRDTSSKKDYLIIDGPNAAFKDSILCPPSTSVIFRNLSIDATSQTWSFGDGNTSAAVSPTHTYAGAGTYTVRLTTSNSASGCTDTFSRRLTLYNSSLSFTADRTNICKDESVQFEATFSVPDAIFTWRINGFLTNPDKYNFYTHQFGTKGYHTVTLIAQSGNGCVDSSVRKDLILVSRPEVGFSVVPPIGCLPLAVRFTDTTRHVPGVSAASRFWDFGDGSTLANTAAPVHTYTVTGNFPVKLLVTDNQGCKDSVLYARAVVVRKPVAAFSADRTTACAFQSVAFSSLAFGATNPLTHLWIFGDGNTSAAINPTHKYAAPGKFTVTLVVTDSSGCTDTSRIIDFLQINAPVAAFSASAHLAICPPLQVTFSNSSTGADKYAWTFGTSGGPVSVTNPVTTFSTPGLYNIRLIATDTYGCTDTASDTVRVLGYDGAFAYSPLTGCAPLTVTFLPPTAGIPSITWDFADGNTATSPGTSVTHTYTTAGPFLPKAIFSDGPSCSSLSTGADTIRIDRITADFTTSVPCVGVPFSITQTASALFANPASFSFAWSFPPTGSASGPDTTYSYNTPGNHPVTLIVSGPPGSGCADTITKQVFVNPLPIVKITGETAICPGTSDTLTASGAKDYIWAVPAVPGAASLSCTACNPTILTPASDTSWVYLSGTDDKGCVNRDSARIIIQIKTELSAGDGGEICIGDSFRLVASGGTRYTWTPAATLDSPLIASPLASPLTTTTYTVAAQKSTCLVDSQRITVVVRPRPVFSAGQDGIMAIGGAVTLIPSGSSVVRVAWKADTTLSCTDCFRPVAHPAVTTTYYATGYNEWGCESTDSVTVIVRCNGDRVFVPNTFTPNGDGLNDRFYPRGDGVGRMSSFRVYNRWGELVFERVNVVLNDELSGWDGSYKGKALPPDVYVYTMQARCDNGEIVNYRGDVTIVK